MGQDLTADILTGEEHTYEADRLFFIDLLKSGAAWSFVRFGDAEFECMVGAGPGYNKDRSRYSPELGSALAESFRYLSSREDVFLAQRCAPQLREQVSQRANSMVALFRRTVCSCTTRVSRWRRSTPF
jgi:hypothetical protein